jgi:hypothetical protein
MADDYRTVLGSLEDWDDYLLSESRLPGPRANLELAYIVADEGSSERFEHLLTYGPERAPTNTPGEFLACCGVLGLGKLLAEGDLTQLPRLRSYASDPRWRVREMVPMALQRYGRVDMDALITEMRQWIGGSHLEQRAAAAALCEPGLLTDQANTEAVFKNLDAITASIEASEDRKNADFKVLRKGMGYCWSVAVAAYPVRGKKYLRRWFDSQDKDIQWINKSNLKKKGLQRLDAEWTANALKRLND